MTAKSKKIWLSTVFLPVLTVLILMCVAFATTEKADAAAKYERLDTRGTPYNTGQRLEAAGGWYLKDWGELYFSKTKEGKARTLVKTSNQLQYPILTNGSKVYYSMDIDSWKKHKAKIYSVGTNGKNRKLIKTLTMQPGEQLELVNIYGNRLYFEKHRDGNCKLYYLTLGKNSKIKKVSSNFHLNTQVNAGPGARYIYDRNQTDRSVRIFDCKTNKVIRRIPQYVYKFTAIQDKVYYVLSAGMYESKVYQASLNGADPTVLVTLPTGSIGVDYLDDTEVYYQVDIETETGVEHFHVYDFATKTHRHIPLEEYRLGY